jgi:tRNA G10  N-methylase Trm11
VDPFGGIGTTGIEGASRGLQVIGVELEAKFVELGNQNIEKHRATWEAFGDPVPVLVQGDSRRLCEVVGPVLCDVVVSSPPYAGNENSDYILTSDGKTRTRDERRGYQQGSGCFRSSEAAYGQTSGQLGNLPSGSVEAIVSSPPYEGSLSGQRDEEKERERCKKNGGDSRKIGPNSGSGSDGYSVSTENLGNQSSTTFWSAAREIVQQCHAILKPGGVAVWVCKDFIRKGKRVPFSDDWRKLCVACGFEMVEWIQASLVKTDSHPSLFDDGPVVKRTERKSFFRRLAEKNGSPPIDHEDVLVMRKFL